MTGITGISYKQRRMPTVRSYAVPTEKSARHANERRKGTGQADQERQSGLEKLEPRIVLSVTIKAVNGDIFISGDAGNDHLSIFEDGAGRLFIYGDVNTALAGDGAVSGVIGDTNAGGGREFDNGLFHRIFVSTGDGDDTVEFAGLKSSDISSLSVDTGNATTSDTVQFQQTTFAGNPDANFGIVGVAGPIHITTGNGSDQVRISDVTTPALSIATGSNNDTVTLADIGALGVNGSTAIDGGDGGDTLIVGGANQHLDLHTLTNLQLAKLEGFDLTGTGNNTLTIDASEVFALSPATHTVIVDGNAGDGTVIGSGWVAGVAQTINLTTYSVYTKDGATLKIAQAVDVDVQLVQTIVVDAKHPAIFADANHDAVTVKLTGKGTATVTLTGGVTNDADISTLVLTGTDAKSAVSITVKRDKLTGDGFTTIGGVTADSALKSFTAPTASFTGSGFVSTGAIKTIAIRDLLAGQIATGGAPADKLALTIGTMADGTAIQSPETITTLKATALGDGTIQANSFGAISTSNGALDADITSSAAIAKITVKGGGLTGHLAASSFGPISITGGDFSGLLTSSTPAATLAKTKALTALSVNGGNITGDINVLGLAGTISVKGKKGGPGGNMDGATIAAHEIAGLSVTGNVNQSLVLAGADLGANHSLGGGDDNFTQGALGAVKIGGNVTGGSAIAAGLSSTNGTLKDGDDSIVGGTMSVIKSFTVAGTADANSYFVAGLFKGKPKIDKVTIDPTADNRFKTLV